MRLKKITAASLAAVMAVSLAACGGGSTEETTAAAGGTETQGQASEGGSGETAEGGLTGELSVTTWDNSTTPQFQAVIDAYMEKNPGVTINIIDTNADEYNNSLGISLSAAQPDPDVIWVKDMGSMLQMADKKQLMPLDDLIEKDSYDLSVYNGAAEQLQYNDTTYALPYRSDWYVLFYNKDLFEQAGLDPNSPPTTYDEMLEIAPKLAALTTEDGNQVYPFGLTTASVAVSGACLTSSVYNFGGTVLDEEGNLAIDQGFRDAVEMWKTLDDNGYNPQNSKLKDLRNLFALGQLAMYYDQSWGYNGISSINPDAESFIASAAPLKGGDGTGESVLQAGTLMVVDNGDAQKAAVAKLVDFIMSEEMLTEYFETVSPAYPARQSMADLEVIADSPILAGAADSVSNLKTVTFVPALSDLNLELCTLAQAVTVSGTDVDTAIADFETAARGILE